MEINVGEGNFETLDRKVEADLERAIRENDLGKAARIRSFRSTVKALVEAIGACSDGSRECTTEEESQGIIEGFAMAITSLYAPQIARLVPACEHVPPCAWMIEMEKVAIVFNLKMMEHAEACFAEAVKTGITQPHQGTA